SRRVLQGERTQRRGGSAIAALVEFLRDGWLSRDARGPACVARETLHADCGGTENLARPLQHVGARSAARDGCETVPGRAPKIGRQVELPIACARRWCRWVWLECRICRRSRRRDRQALSESKVLDQKA